MPHQVWRRWFSPFKRLHHVQRPREPGNAEGGGPGSPSWPEAAAARCWAGVLATPERAAAGGAGGSGAASLLPLALDSSAWRSAVPLPFGVGTKHNDFLESKGCFANITSSGRSVSPSSSIETGPSVSEPFSPSRRSVHLDPAAVLDLKSSSSHSDHSSEISLPEVQKDKCPKEFSLLKLQTKDGQRPEWTFYPRFSSNIHTYHVGKQCFFNGVFLGNRRSLSERTVDKCFGRKKYVLDPRNGIPKLTPGDNTYMCPEQSKGFYKAGSTLPPVNFSVVPYEKKFDTFIPLEPLPQIPNLPFWVKEKANNLKNEIREVEELENWQPAVPLVQSLLPVGGSKHLQKIA